MLHVCHVSMLESYYQRTLIGSRPKCCQRISPVMCAPTETRRPARGVAEGLTGAHAIIPYRPPCCCCCCMQVMDALRCLMQAGAAAGCQGSERFPHYKYLHGKSVSISTSNSESSPPSYQQQPVHSCMQVMRATPATMHTQPAIMHSSALLLFPALTSVAAHFSSSRPVRTLRPLPSYSLSSSEMSPRATLPSCSSCVGRGAGLLQRGRVMGWGAGAGGGAPGGQVEGQGEERMVVHQQMLPGAAQHSCPLCITVPM
jgi:hypothetical protein